VVAADPTTNRTSRREVTDVIVGHGEKELVGVTVATAAGTAQIVATDGHPFGVDAQGRWLDAGDLGTGDELETAEQGRATVVATWTWKQVRTVYNLTVDGVHTYYVVAGDTPVLVHNCGEIDDISRNIADHSRKRFSDPDGLDHYVRGVDPKALGHYVDGVVNGHVPHVQIRYLERGRVAYWDPSKRAVILEEGNGGSVFTPRNGKDYFSDLE
jgi:hypothetical protein